MHVVATAGHVDHGKSTLVRALTGMEPDRFAEEKRRGMTIDLGYAWTALPSGEQLAFVDVPGHERFIANMLAGLGPAPGVLFVVAADEGWSSQSEEHLAAIDALDLRHGVLAVTRSDLAPPDAARAESLDRISRSSLDSVEAIACSGRVGTGLDELCGALDRMVAAISAPDPSVRVRLWVDRSFTMRGSGTVVTGTLSAGTIAVDDELSVLGRTVGVRALQSLGQPHERISGPARVAVNLRGVAPSEVTRGDVLTTPDAWHWTQVVDARIRPDVELPEQLILHVGSAAAPVRVRRLGGDIVRLTIGRDLPMQQGDRGVLRDPGRHAIAAGVLILDPDPPELRRRGAAARRAADLRVATDVPDLAVELHRRGAVRRVYLQRLGIATDGHTDRAGWLVDDAAWSGWCDRVRPAIEQWAAVHPLEPGMPTAVLVRHLRLPDAALLPYLLDELRIAAHDGRVGERSEALGPAEAAVRTLEARLAPQPFAAPESRDLAALGIGNRELAAAQQVGRLLRLGDVVLLPSAPEQAVDVLRELPQPFTTSQARQALNTTRRVAIPLLEHLDALGSTVRIDATTRRVTVQP